jgi:hypothetical protein
MARIGHSSTRAVMIYQHATRDRDQAIAATLDALINEADVSGATRPQREPEVRERVGHVLGKQHDHEPEITNALAEG